MELLGISWHHSGDCLRGRMRRYLWAELHVSGASPEVVQKHPYSRTEDGFPLHGGDRTQPPSETHTQRNYENWLRRANPLKKCATDITKIKAESKKCCVSAIHFDRGTQYLSKAYRRAAAKHGILQSMNSSGGRYHDNTWCKNMWARMKEELIYGRCTTERMALKERTSIRGYFISYWNNRRIWSANEGLPPMVKRQRYYESLGYAA